MPANKRGQRIMYATSCLFEMHLLISGTRFHRCKQVPPCAWLPSRVESTGRRDAVSHPGVTSPPSCTYFNSHARVCPLNAPREELPKRSQLVWMHHHGMTAPRTECKCHRHTQPSGTSNREGVAGRSPRARGLPWIRDGRYPCATRRRNNRSSRAPAKVSLPETSSAAGGVIPAVARLSQCLN